MASREYAKRRSETQLERETPLRRIVSFLCSEGVGDWSFASLSAALDVPQAKLRKEFGTETALLETARKLLPDVVLAGLAEPLRTARTGRDAVHGMLEVAVSLRKGHRQLKDHTAAGPSLAMERNSDDQAIQHWGRSLEYQIHDRFARSVDEGELPEGANIRSLSALTLAVVNGLVFCVQEEVSA